ncbi:MAG TPA: DJ-1/PfpI family protein [Pseudonocardiaceae bacterium]|jgi:putative intracellular protease/amidase
MMTKTVHVAVYDALADWEVGYAIGHINSSFGQHAPGRYEVRTVGPSLAPVTTLGGMRVLPDVALADLTPADSAMLILPGASTWDNGDNVAFGRLARAFLAAGVPVAAICGATAGLAMEGLLDDRDHTSGAVEYLMPTGYAGAARYRDTAVVTDGDLITAGPTAPVEFAHAVLARLGIYTPDALAAWYRLFGAQDAGAFFELAAVVPQ